MYLPERESELPGHGAVEDEVDHAVDQSHHVHQLWEKEGHQSSDQSELNKCPLTSPTGL